MYCIIYRNELTFRCLSLQQLHFLHAKTLVIFQSVNKNNPRMYSVVIKDSRNGMTTMQIWIYIIIMYPKEMYTKDIVTVRMHYWFFALSTQSVVERCSCYYSCDLWHVDELCNRYTDRAQLPRILLLLSFHITSEEVIFCYLCLSKVYAVACISKILLNDVLFQIVRNYLW